MDSRPNNCTIFTLWLYLDHRVRTHHCLNGASLLYANTKCTPQILVRCPMALFKKFYSTTKPAQRLFFYETTVKSSENQEYLFFLGPRSNQGIKINKKPKQKMLRNAQDSGQSAVTPGHQHACNEAIITAVPLLPLLANNVTNEDLASPPVHTVLDDDP